MYIKVKNNVIEYPYSVAKLKEDNRDTSFPAVLNNDFLQQWDMYPVILVDKPNVDYTKNVTEGLPVFENNKWMQTWEVTDKQYDELLQTILNLRASEYPPMSDYLDGIVKGDQAQVDKYIADCLAVKAKYPKP